MFKNKVKLLQLPKSNNWNAIIFQKSLNINAEATCVKINHNGQLILVGTQEGSVLLLDYRKNEVIENWSNHQYPIVQLEITADYTHFYTLARDKV